MNIMNDISESDWKLLKELKPLVLDRLCAHILQKVAEQCDPGPETNHQRFLKARSLIENVNVEIAKAFDDMPRETALSRLKSLFSQGLISDEELSRFSAETISEVRRIDTGR